jgi:alkanesulfonate monooxygenase SsuD/methylene tetrahydromethanopterin reductase-like flavin-dependent oxidoreductase (luciferase family)
MRFSLVVPSQRSTPEGRVFDLPGLVQECQAAEDAGIYAVYTGERRATGSTSYSHNPLLMSAFILSHTEHVRVAAGLVVLPLHHPVAVIQDASLLSAMYDGRFRLAVGAGYAHADFEALGVPLEQRAARMEAGLRAMNAYRNGENHEIGAPYAGSVPRRDEALGEDRLDVMAGGWSNAGVRRAATYADGWISGPLDTVHALERFTTIYRERCRAAGREPYVAIMREAWLADTDEEAVETYGHHVLAYHRLYLERGHVYDPEFDPWASGIEPHELTLDHILPDRVLCGSPATWHENL